jgi:hypothetical protein
MALDLNNFFEEKKKDTRGEEDTRERVENIKRHY